MVFLRCLFRQPKAQNPAASRSREAAAAEFEGGGCDMAAKQELQVQQKREVEKKEEQTIPARTFMPNTDIYETDENLTVVMEMPGVQKDNIDVAVEENVLKVYGRLNFSNYEGLQPVYTEYNVGNYARNFQLSSKIDQSKISAKMNDGVLHLVLPKTKEATPRVISVS
jgi:HSP20 family protein